MSADTEHAGHAPATGDVKSLVIIGALTGVYFVFELVVGLAIGSVAVISDAFHTFSAVGGVLVALVASFFSQREASRLHTYGWVRAEIIGALFNGLFLAGMALVVLWMGARRLQDPVELSTTPMLLVAAGGLATELISFVLLYERQKENLNVRGAFWHVLQTLVGSLIIIVSAVAIRFTGFLEIDPLLGMAFGVLLVWASWRITSDSLHILLQQTPEDLDLDAAIAAITGIDEVDGVHHVHAWSLTQGRIIFSGHVVVTSMDRAGETLREINALLMDRFGIYFATIQIETRRLPEEGAEDIDLLLQDEDL